MVHQMMPTTKTAHTLGTLEWLLALVDQHMGFQLVGVGEPTGAQFTGVWPFTSVYPQVAPQVRHLHELPIAVCTVIWFLARMQPHVCLQVVISGEPLMALAAFEWLLTSVGSFMIL